MKTKTVKSPQTQEELAVWKIFLEMEKCSGTNYLVDIANTIVWRAEVWDSGRICFIQKVISNRDNDESFARVKEGALLNKRTIFINPYGSTDSE